MAFRFLKKDRSVEIAMRRIARKQIDRAVESAESVEHLADAVHDVRKRCKMLRGLIRLMRPTFEAYADENADFRDIGRLLSGPREAEVLHETCDRLAQLDNRSASIRRFKGSLPAREPRVDVIERLDEVRERLLQARRRLAGWSLAANGWEAIGPGFMQTYMRAREALERIGESHAPERYHELRKQVKYHSYHLRLLRPVAPKALAARTKSAAEAGECLGEHHDLAVLQDAIGRRKGAFGGEGKAEAVQQLIRRQRLLVEERCLRVVPPLLAESAESLTEQLGAKWRAWRD